ncbi:hypothetical protein [Pseudomonas sp. ESBL1]|uniref:hypothetical protein n=1 Tax=Pseudomonas sp. ESBL1 TaxID=3077324 RepID=UPI002FC87D48
MTVSTTDSVEEYVSGGPAFPIPYRFLQDSDIEVVLVRQNGESETLVLGTQYTLTGAGSQDGGTLTSTYAASVLATPGATLSISRVMTAVQPTDLRNQGRYFAETHENVFDRLTMLIQQGFSWLSRALVRPIGKNYYDAEGRQIKNLADPTDAQDATTMAWVGDFFANIQGPINNSNNVFYQYPDGSPHVVQDLSSTTGADGIGYGSGSVGDVLDGLDGRFAAMSAEIDADIVAYNNGFVSPRGGNLSTAVKAALTTLGSVGRSGIYSTPIGFNTRFGPLWLRKDGSGNADLISNLDKYKPAGAFATPDNYTALGLKAYFVSTSGSDAAAGTTWATALRTVAAATQKADVDVIFVAGGKGANYFAAQHHGTYAGARSIAIHAIGGRVRFISGPTANAAPTWNATGVAGVYKQGSTDASITGVVSLDYTDELGNPLTLLPASDVNGVGAVPGSWFRSATELFISLPDGSQPSSNTYFYYSAPMRVTGGNKAFYARGIDYVGGNAGAFSARNGNGNTIIFMEDCGFCGQASGDGFQIKNLGLAIAVRCRASRNANDGFNYHGPDDTTPYVDPHFLEYMCLGAFNRAVGTGNGSTAHELVRGIRINCHYYGNAGPGVADVNDAQTYNVGCTSRDNGPNVNAFGFVVSADSATSGGAVMFVDGCVSDGNAGEDIRSQNGAKLYYRDVWSGRDRISVDGTSSAAQFG